VLQTPGLPAGQELAVGFEADSPGTGGFASLQPADADYAVEVCREQDSLVTSPVPLRLVPEHGPGRSLTTKTPRHGRRTRRSQELEARYQKSEVRTGIPPRKHETN
jgi:hypothetical protein